MARAKKKPIGKCLVLFNANILYITSLKCKPCCPALAAGRKEYYSLRFTIDLIPITKKNSQQIVKGKNGRPIIIPSAAYKKYEKGCKRYMPKTDEPIDYPINIKAVYYMPTRRRVDLTNLHEALHDILVKYGVILDDNSKIVVSTDGSRVMYDKDFPRTEVVITRIDGRSGK